MEVINLCTHHIRFVRANITGNKLAHKIQDMYCNTWSIIEQVNLYNQ